MFAKNLALFLHIFIWLQQVLVAACRIFSSRTETLNCGRWHLDPQTRIKPRAPVLRAWSLSHWTIREVPTLALEEENNHGLLTF